MKTIWKFQFGVSDRITLRMPKGAEIVSAGLQEGIPTMWGKVDTEAPPELHTFRIIGTGHECPDSKYITTFQMPPFVWHLFEEE